MLLPAATSRPTVYAHSAADVVMTIVNGRICTKRRLDDKDEDELRADVARAPVICHQ
jgi:hypothetical protein